MKKVMITIGIFFLISCGKQTAPSINIEDKEAITANADDSQRMGLPETEGVTIPDKIAEANDKELPQFSTSAPQLDKNGPMSDTNHTDSTTDNEMGMENDPDRILAGTEEKDEIKLVTERPEKVFQVEAAEFPNFAWEEYMILPGDFLIKIANKEYGDFRMWRKIYEWNRDQIGNNPNIIYPYQFLNLMKDRELVKETKPVFFTYNVQPGDNLWNIAGKQYGDPKSWIILLWDNEKVIKNSNGILTPGMSLLLREKLDPKA